MATAPQPRWLIDLLEQSSWTDHEFFGVVCGEDPAVAATSPDLWTAERRRVARLVDAAIRTGGLLVEFTGLATSDAPFGRFEILRNEAVRWILAHRSSLPQCPLRWNELEKAELLRHRQRLLTDYKRATGITANKRIYEDSNACIHKPQFYAWLKGDLPPTSATAMNFERFLTEKRSTRKRD